MAKKAHKYFYPSGKFKWDIDNEWSLEMAFKRDLPENDKVISDFTISLLKDMFNYDPTLRPTFLEIISRIDEYITYS